MSAGEPNFYISAVHDLKIKDGESEIDVSYCSPKWDNEDDTPAESTLHYDADYDDSSVICGQVFVELALLTLRKDTKKTLYTPPPPA